MFVLVFVYRVFVVRALTEILGTFFLGNVQMGNSASDCMLKQGSDVTTKLRLNI